MLYYKLDEGIGTIIKNSSIHGGSFSSSKIKWTSNIGKWFDGRNTCKSDLDCSKYSIPVNVNTP